jgi:hypothetical protein
VKTTRHNLSVEVNGSGIVGIAISQLSMRLMKGGVTVESTIPQLLTGQLGGWYESGFSDMDNSFNIEGVGLCPGNADSYPHGSHSGPLQPSK